jgi:serine/threonine protein kinase
VLIAHKEKPIDIYPPHSLIIDRYEVNQAPDIEHGIRVGGMGLVYICHDRKEDIPVALKFFKPEYLANHAAVDRFLFEGNAWIELGNHPHIVRCYDVKYVDPTAFLVLELIANEQYPNDASLRSWMNTHMPLEQALLFSLQIARGMYYAEQKIHGFVHRDLKPENILVGADKLSGTSINRLRVTDFGLIKIVVNDTVHVPSGNADEVQSDSTQFTSNIGTPGYMAPEQWKGERVGAFTDIYALGCMFHEMVTGKAVLGDLSETKYSRKLPSSVLKFLRCCLSTAVSERYQTWDEVIAVLKEIYVSRVGGVVPPEPEQVDESHAERRSRATSFNAMGISYAHNGEIQKALNSFESAFHSFQEISDREGEGIASGNLGNTYAKLNKMDDAFRYCRMDLEIARERHDRQRESVALGSMGELCRNIGRISEAISYHEKRLQIVRDDNDLRGEGNALCSLGLDCLEQNETQLALDYFNRALDIFLKIDDQRGKANALGGMGNAYIKFNDTSSAINHYRQQQKIAQQIGDRDGEGIALVNLGNIYLTLGDARTAIDFFYSRRLEIARQTGDRRGESNVLVNLGVAYGKLGNTQDAFNCFKQSFTISREIGDQVGFCSTLFNLGHFYRENSLYDEALSVWVNLYIFAKQRNLGQALRSLEDLAPKIGISDGLVGWDALARERLRKKAENEQFGMK